MFGWDPAKRLTNSREHHLDFIDAQQMFDGRPINHVPAWRNDEDRVVSTA